MWKRALVCLAVGVGFLVLALWLAPRQARAIRAPFREHGQETTGVVVEKAIARRTYEGGGQDGGTKSYRERSVTVRIPREADRQVTIDDLVFAADYERLKIGDEVAVTWITSQHTKKPPYYLLSSSVDAGWSKLVPWAFDGRPASGLAIWAAIPAVLGLILGFGFGWEAIRRRR